MLFKIFVIMNLLAAKGVIVREYPTDTGEVDYLIFINAQPVGIIEAKEINKGEKLVVETEKQTERYKNSKLSISQRAYILDLHMSRQGKLLDLPIITTLIIAREKFFLSISLKNWKD